MKLARPLLAIAAVASLAAASTAHARTDFVVSIGVPAPVYVQPRPVYVQPQPVYVAPRVVYHQPARVQYRGRGGQWGDADRDGVPNVYDRNSRFYDARAARQARRDRDGDGVPNRFDRAPNSPYYR
jgi:PXPV repeat (3 copies)